MKESTTTTKNTAERLIDLELLALLKSDLRNFKRKKEEAQQRPLQAA
ncbi:hypothetical protein [Desertivirga brevis]|nr:hypothetical protein [Pedobacter sp. SYSU D00873]